MRSTFLVFAFAALGACGSKTSGPTIAISSGMAWPATTLTVAAGSTITVTNNDSGTHTATSQSGAGAFDGNAATGGFKFDTGNISPGSSATIEVPSTAVSGTQQFFFCKNHMGGMVNPNPSITIK